MRKGGFVLREDRGIPYYSCEAFDRIAHLRHGFSTRADGSGTPKQPLNLGHASWDSVERVNENRQRFLSALDLEKAQLTTLHQVHSNRVYIIEDYACEWNQSEGDALATKLEDIALAVKIADCLPVLIADPVNRAVAAVHSGWRGTLSRILLKTIEAMQKSLGSSPADLLVAVGPGIRECCYEVGSEVERLFEKEYPTAHVAAPVVSQPGKYHLDLCKVLDIQLDLAGVHPENRHDLGACTRCSPESFFSYRAEGPASGRMMAVIGLTGKSHPDSIVTHPA